MNKTTQRKIEDGQLERLTKIRATYAALVKELEAWQREVIPPIVNSEKMSGTSLANDVEDLLLMDGSNHGHVIFEVSLVKRNKMENPYRWKTLMIHDDGKVEVTAD
jgi:hypothetical protein